MFSVGIGRLVKEEIVMTGLRSRPGSLGIAVCSSLMLAMVAGISLSELRADITPLSGAEAQRVLGGQSSCVSAPYALQISSQGCDGNTCPKQQNAFYSANGAATATILSKYCRDIFGQPCGNVQVDLPKCSL
jgi:hypothetical protein